MTNEVKEFWRIVATTAAVLVAFLAVLFLCGGCSSTPSGVKVIASSASYTNIGDINWDEYKIPVVSIYLGPKATVWVNKDYRWLRSVEVSGVVTNRTSALAIYDSTEEKHLNLTVEFSPDATNAVSVTRR